MRLMTLRHRRHAYVPRSHATKWARRRHRALGPYRRDDIDYYFI